MGKRKYFEGMSTINSQGIKMTIVKYISNREIIVEFDDELHTKVNTNGTSFKEGTTVNPNLDRGYKRHREERLGLIDVNKYGEKMKIIEYYSSSNIVVEFFHNHEKVNATWNQWQKKVVKSSTAIIYSSKFVDLTGQTYGYLKVIEWDTHPPDNFKLDRLSGLWKCQCLLCGEYTWVKAHRLKSGKTKTCKKCCSRKINEYDLSGEYGIGYTTNTNKPFYFDLEDYDRIKEHAWLENNGYIVTSIENKHVLLHRFILDVSDFKIQVDHIGHKPYDNRKKYLRICSNTENQHNKGINKNNTSGFTGINEQHGKWRAYIWRNSKYIHLGMFDNKEDAIAARKAAEEKYYGEYSYDNSMRKVEVIN